MNESIAFQEMARDAMKERRWDAVWVILREVAHLATQQRGRSYYDKLVFFCITTDCQGFGEWFIRSPGEQPPTPCLYCHQLPYEVFGIFPGAR